MAFTTRLHAVAEAVPMHTQVKFSYQTEAGTLKFEMGKDGQRLLLGKGSFGKVPHCVALPIAAAIHTLQGCRRVTGQLSFDRRKAAAVHPLRR